VEYFSSLESLVTSDSECAFEVKSRISMAKAAFSKKKTLFTSKLDLILRKKRLKCYIWRLALYGAETWTLREVDKKYLECWKYGAEERWRRSVGLIT
jgi:hypothetical protein